MCFFSSLSKVKIERVGSCCTLIGEKLLTSNTHFQITSEIAYLLTGKRIENRQRKNNRRIKKEKKR